MEGHRGEDSGFEERGHRAMEYNSSKKKGLRKDGRKVVLGAR